MKLVLLSILSAVDGVAVGLTVAVGVAVGVAVKDVVERVAAPNLETADFAVVHVSFDTPNGPKWVVMAEVRAVAKDRVALTIFEIWLTVDIVSC